MLVIAKPPRPLHPVSPEPAPGQYPPGARTEGPRTHLPPAARGSKGAVSLPEGTDAQTPHASAPLAESIPDRLESAERAPPRPRPVANMLPDKVSAPHPSGVRVRRTAQEADAIPSRCSHPAARA